MDGQKRCFNVCRTMEEIDRNHSDVFPNKLLRYGWSASNPWDEDSGAELLWVNFVHCFADGSTCEHRFDTDYAPINWSMIPAFLNIFRGRKWKHKFKDKAVKSLKRSTPFMILHDDWDEDDTLNIYTCSEEELDKMMDVNHKMFPLWNIINNNGSVKYNIDLYVGLIDGDNVKIIPEGYKPNPFECDSMGATEWKKCIHDSISQGYKPFFIQCAEWDCDDFEVVYWLNKEDPKGDNDDED